MRIVGFLFFLLLLGGFALVALKGRQVAEDGLADATFADHLNSHWRAIALPDVTLADESPPVLRFGDAGELSGDSGCNFYSGSYTLDDTGFTVGALRATRKACSEPLMNQERAFFDALSAARKVEFSDRRLRLLDADDEPRAEFERYEPD